MFCYKTKQNLEISHKLYNFVAKYINLNMKLSIIVPVYNVEKYIRPCIESIFKQGLDDADFEVIIVNDGSTDHSMEMIKDLINKHHNVLVINQENQSLSVARNNGVAIAKGEYILMPDSDDLLVDNSVKPLLEIALEKKVDIIVAEFLSINDNDIASFLGVVQEKFSYQEMTGEELLLELNPRQCYVWRALYKRSFIQDNHLSFIPGINYQDVPFTHECYLKAQHCIKTPWLLNIYRANRPLSGTSFFSLKKSISYCTAIASTWDLRKTKGISPQALYKLEEDVFISFKMMTYHTLHSIHKSSERKAVMSLLNATAPHLNFTHGFRQKITTFMIKRMPSLYIECYHLYAQIAYKMR